MSISAVDGCNRSLRPWSTKLREAGNGRESSKSGGCQPSPQSRIGRFHGLSERLPMDVTARPAGAGTLYSTCGRPGGMSVNVGATPAAISACASNMSLNSSSTSASVISASDGPTCRFTTRTDGSAYSMTAVSPFRAILTWSGAAGRGFFSLVLPPPPSVAVAPVPRRAEFPDTLSALPA